MEEEQRFHCNLDLGEKTELETEERERDRERRSYGSVTQRVQHTVGRGIAQQPPAHHRHWEVEAAEN